MKLGGPSLPSHTHRGSGLSQINRNAPFVSRPFYPSLVRVVIKQSSTVEHINGLGPGGLNRMNRGLTLLSVSPLTTAECSAWSSASTSPSHSRSRCRASAPSELTFLWKQQCQPCVGIFSFFRLAHFISTALWTRPCVCVCVFVGVESLFFFMLF